MAELLKEAQAKEKKFEKEAQQYLLLNQKLQRDAVGLKDLRDRLVRDNEQLEIAKTKYKS